MTTQLEIEQAIAEAERNELNDLMIELALGGRNVLS